MADVHQITHGAWFACRIWYLAWYYQKHEQLPPELQGGLHKHASHLYDDDVEQCAQAWLAAQVASTVTPATFHVALNDEILPSLCVILKKPLCEHTAHRWLHKLGYRKDKIWKGVYMDGHERTDIVKY